MSEMFCFQCEQAAGGTGCTKVGVCGKTPVVSNKQDELVASLIGLAKVALNKNNPKELDELMMKGLFATLTNVNFDEKSIDKLNEEVIEQKNKLGGAVYNVDKLWAGDTDIVSLRSTLLLGLKGMAAYAIHAFVLGKTDAEVSGWLYKGLAALDEEHTVDEWLNLLMEFGNVNLKCMQLLDEANTSAYGHPAPAKVTMNVEKGPFIIISGHDLLDLKQLLDQTEGKGVNIYTHGEMLPAHGYPELNKYAHLKGNFGTAWQNQQKEFDNVPAPILFTTNCIMKPKDNYYNRVYTTSVVGYEGLAHIEDGANGVKDFSPIINQAIELGGFKEDKEFTGINGGASVMTGFARNTVLGVADKVIDAVKAGAIKHFLLVGGCDGAKPGRNYYTELVEKSPKDTVILTLACGKYRFNDLDIGEIGGLPRIMDMGQCNDAYSAISVAVALSKAFDCSVNELPLTLVLSWYEQKAVCILLTLLALGIKNIYLGPTLPAFLSSNVLNVLVEKFDLKPTTTADADLKAILG
jgi:hydroxylamine reductase